MHFPDVRTGNLCFLFGSERASMASSRDLTCQIQKPAIKLLGLGEGAVDDGTRLAGEFDACAFGAWLEAVHGEHDASLDELFVELAHLGHEFWIGEGAFFFISGVDLRMTMNRIAKSPLG